MKFCMHCGQQLPDDARYCDFCGAAAPADFSAAAPGQPDPNMKEVQEERECLDNMRKMLRGEYLSWLISTWVILGITIFYLLFLTIFAVVFSVAADVPEAGLLFGVLIVYFAILIAPRIVVGFIMASRSKGYMRNIYDRPEEAIERCGHAGIIVLGAFFNEVALIFIIINFVRCKRRRKVFDRIVSKRRSL